MTELSLQQQFADSLGQLLGPEFPSDIALAVSGGGDSMAMLYLAHNWTRDWGVRLHVVTVDHGLRPESADEAAMVASECAALGWRHVTLTWSWDGSGNKMDAARRARLALIDDWRGQIAHVLMAHTEDDLAETFLMRLRRGAGLDGLAAMAPKRFVTGKAGSGFHVIRPCLGMARKDLRHYLRTLQGPWVDDPSNDDPRYDRARIRRLLSALGDEGLDRRVLAAAATRLRTEKAVVTQHAARIWQEIGEDVVTQGARTGIVRLKPDWHRAVDVATQRRILSAVLRYVSSTDYPPRAEALEVFRDRLVSGGTGPLHGCDAVVLDGWTYLFRELTSVAPPCVLAQPETLWDGRWLARRSGRAVVQIRALGEDGWRQIPDKPGQILRHRLALSLPSVWEGDHLLACPALGFGSGQHITLRPKGQIGADLSDFLLSH